MTDQRRPTDAEDITKPDDYQAEEKVATDEGRRKFTKAGIASVPVILTLASRPALGGGYGGGGYVGKGYGGGKYHCTVSGMLSGNLSKPDDYTCEGCTPGYWGTHPKKWYDCGHKPGACKIGWSGNHCQGHEYHDYDYDASGYYPDPSNPASKFHDHFAGTYFGDMTMMQVIQEGGKPGVGDQYQLGAHTCAALLNTSSGMNYGYTPQQVIDLYNDHYASEPEALKNTFEMLNTRYCPY